MSRLVNIRTILTLAIFCLLSTDSLAQFYNGTQTTFGKNRVQYDDFEWQFYRFKEFETYFYTGGKTLAVHTAHYANKRIPELEKFLDFYLEDRIQFIIYNKQSHFRQSNIGLNTNPNYNIGGLSRIVGSKVFIYFEGDYEKLEKQIDAGIQRVLIYQMIFGGNWREVLRNSALLSLPEWYIEGLISYLSYPDDPYLNSRIKDGILNEDFKKFNTLSNEEAKIAGHAIWQYISEVYGKKVISNILYMTRVSREVEDGFLYVIGVPFDELYEDWLSYYQEKYEDKNSTQLEAITNADFKVKKRRLYQNYIESPNQQYHLYTENQLGKYRIYLYNKSEDNRKLIYKAEHKLDRIQDYSYPLIGFHPSGEMINFITESKGDVLLFTYQIKEKKLAVKPILKLEKVLSFDYSPNGKELVFSAISKGQSDLYLYNMLGNTQKNLTSDVYSDLYPAFSPDGSSIYFSSDRNNDSLGIENPTYDRFNHEKDIFEYRFNEEEAIREVTNSPFENESQAVYSDKLYYLKNKDGFNERYYTLYDSSISSIDTTINYKYYYEHFSNNNSNNILKQASSNTENINQIIYSDGKFQLQQSANQFDFTASEDNLEDNRIDPSFKEEEKIVRFKSFEKALPSNAEVDPDEYTFSFEEGLARKTIVSNTEEPEVEELKFPTQRLYRLNFSPDNSVLQLNNMFLTSQYQVFNGGPYTNPGVGVNTNIGIVDLMENHKVYGSFRYSGDLIEYGLNYQNLEKRLDKEYSFSRRRLRTTDTPFPFDTKTLQASVSLIWPFNEVSSIRGVVQARNDKLIPLSSDRFNLQRDISNEYWASTKVAYVFDNTRDIALNIRYGTRYKIFAEQYQLAYTEVENAEKNQNLTVLGFDFRHYQKIHRELIGVFRFAGSKSLGNNPLIYYLGGVDEWWKSDIYDESTPIDFSQNYGFQALAANMRGFLQNVRNGNNFAVINTEIRFPVFTYFIKRPIQSDLIRNFQIVGFGDVGTAWVGDSPFADDNPINNESRTQGPITVTYENINDPIVGGVGFGLRTTLLGYFVRADWGWGIENGYVSDKPLFMFSLSLDI